MKSSLHTLILLFLSFVLVACFGGGGGGSAATYTIGGHVTNLSGSGLVIQNNGSDNLAITANGGFTFPTLMAEGSSYNVTILTQPAGQTCMVSNGSGTVSGEYDAVVYIGCNDNNTIGGTVSGLSGTVVLQNNSADDLSLTANGDFTFSTDLAYGTGYNVTILTQPAGQTCTIFNASGTVAGADVVNVSVICGTNYNIGGTVSGLVGTGLVLQNNGTNNLSITTNGDFTFTTTIIDGTDYSVTVLNQPTSPSQTCSISDGSGTVGGGDITNVTVTCITNSYSIGVTVSGLTGTGLVLQNNDTNNLSITANGDFTFTATIIDGNDYNVTVLTHPTGQVCPVTGNSGTVSGANVTDIIVTCLTPPGDVAALYSINGSSWNDYVVDDGASFTQATDTACNADTDTACLHGGELRVFDVTDKSSCTGLTAKDSLEVFDWNCDDSTGTVRFISTGLKNGKGLSDLMDFTTPGWKENSLAIYDGQNIHTASSSTVWWSNPVMENTTGGVLNVVGAIYVVPDNTVATTYEFTTNNVALVAAPGVVINGPAGGDSSYVISAISINFLWIEGMTVSAVGDDLGVYWVTKFSAMRDLMAMGADTGTYKSGIMFGGSNNILTDVTVTNNDASGITLGGSNNIVSGMIATNNRVIGINLYASSNNTFSGLSASNNGWYGVRLFSSANNNTLSDVTASNNGYAGVYLGDSSGYNTLLNVTTNNTAGYGIYLGSPGYNTLSGVAASNNGYGLYLDSSNGNTVSGLTATDSTYGIYLDTSSNNYFTESLKVGNSYTTDCYVIGGASPGLINSTCANNGASDATLTIGVTLSSSFIAKVTVDDTVNLSDTLGTATYPTDPLAFDWTHFENAYRHWGRDGNASTSQGSWGSGTGRIWDWSLLATDTKLKDVLSLPTGNDTLTHTWSDTSTTIILRNAREIQGDNIGNENTLCETNETCLYTPNMGSYQGHGNLISAGSISTGSTLENIILMKYGTNGYQ